MSCCIISWDIFFADNIVLLNMTRDENIVAKGEIVKLIKSNFLLLSQCFHLLSLIILFDMFALMCSKSAAAGSSYVERVNYRHIN